MSLTKDLDSLMGCNSSKKSSRKKLKMSSYNRRKIDASKGTRKRRRKGQRISKGDYKRTRI